MGVQKQFRKMLEEIPAGGYALHGTSYGAAKLIENEGLKTRAYPYVAVIPSFPLLKFGQQFEDPHLFERAIGSALFAGGYSFLRKNQDGHVQRTDFFDPQLPEDHLPSIVIAKSRVQEFGQQGYDENLPHERDRKMQGGRQKQYRSFGKIPHSFGAEQVAAIVRITPAEHKELIEKASARANGMDTQEKYNELSRLMKARLVLKTLAQIRNLNAQAKS